MSAIGKKRSPGEFIQGVVGKAVIVKLNNGTDYRGDLTCLDGYMNVVLDNAQEFSPTGAVVANYSSNLFLRGNNVLYISADEGDGER
ncbi:unnamed protein product [Amoebophrya sp. A120]|nr:unnamed protein product [Amoebophrya sp. A120]|eukprot:GSA120T00001208001.1